MLHEIFPHTFDNRFLSKTDINNDNYLLHYQENTVLLKVKGNGLEIPTRKDYAELPEDARTSFLFSLDGTPCFLLWDCSGIKAGNDLQYNEISFFRTSKQKEIAWITIIGYQLWNWYENNKYCGKCGSDTEEKSYERALVCENCGTVVYPKISPAIIVAIISGDKILLAHNSNFPGNWYSLVAGYVDIGESLEETVLREVREEVGLDVKNIRYYKSQPWALSGSMMIGFIAEADPNQKIITDNIEITEAAWFTRGSLPNHPPKISIAGEMIEKFEKDEL